MNELSVKGTVVRNYKMEKNTDYIGFAAAVNNSGLIISDATVEKFRSDDAIQASDNDITLSVSDLTGHAAVCLSKEGVSPIEELTAGLSAAPAPTAKYSGTTVFEGLRTMDAADLLPNFDRPRILRTSDAVPQPTTRRCVML